ncbi:MAG: hypothetical protein H6811_10255 [Phycisphaeraceae bacterium]|nr:hypothetical protein [Phycisphaeraceae bacterium]
MRATPDASLSETPLPCVRCGYDLRSLPLTGVCPECAEAVLFAHRGPRLWNLSEPVLVAQLRGARLVSLGLWCMAVSWALRVWLEHPALTAISIVGAPAILLGLWWLTRADGLAGWSPRARRARVLLRVGIGIDAASTAAAVAALLLFPGRHDELFSLRARFGWSADGAGRVFATLGILAAGARAVTIWLATSHLATLAVLAEDPPVHRRAIGLSRALPVLTLLFTIGGAAAILAAATDTVGFFVIWAIALVAALVAVFTGLQRVLSATHSNLAAALITRRYSSPESPSHPGAPDAATNDLDRRQ